MTIPPALIAALSARDAGRFAEAASLLRPLAESGHVEAQAHLGSLMMLGLHWFATEAEATAWDLTATAGERAARERDSKGDVEQAMRWLQNASAHGIGPASQNWRPPTSPAAATCPRTNDGPKCRSCSPTHATRASPSSPANKASNDTWHRWRTARPAPASACPGKNHPTRARHESPPDDWV